MSVSIEDVGGAGSLATGTFLYIAEALKIANINDVLTGLSLAGGLVWMGYKIAGQRLENKIKKEKLDELKEDNRDN